MRGGTCGVSGVDVEGEEAAMFHQAEISRSERLVSRSVLECVGDKQSVFRAEECLGGDRSLSPDMQSQKTDY